MFLIQYQKYFPFACCDYFGSHPQINLPLMELMLPYDPPPPKKKGGEKALWFNENNDK